MKILNLYAGIGGNRKLWGGEHEVTAVEWDEETAKVYKDYFPNDKVVVTDAHQYLIENCEEYDFIWSSPPCPTHSVTNGFLNAQGVKRYPDMRLYQEIIYLDKFFGGKYCVENVRSYYEPLIEPQKLNRHYFWCNFKLGNGEIGLNDFNTLNAHSSTRLKSDEYMQKLINLYGFDLNDCELSKSKCIKMLRNCVSPETGKYILDRAQEIVIRSNTEQTALSL
jgi:DNA (cytosine-5)-methyltransferase 1